MIGIDGPNGTMTYIDLVPVNSSNIGIISPSPASIGVSSKYFGPPLTVAATYNTSALQEAELLNLASAYNLLAQMGIYQYQTFPFGGKNVGNCRSFADDLLQGVGAK